MVAVKPIASLSSGLLARKGQAKPAMRPQGFHGLGPANSLEDLGWNDMGDPEPAPAAGAPAMPLPPVLRQREELAEELVGAPPPAPAPKAPVDLEPTKRPGISLATAERIGRETRRRAGKAAFTLRLDGERHLRLRLASAIDGRSSQQLVTEALDRLFTDNPGLMAMLDQLANPRKD